MGSRCWRLLHVFFWSFSSDTGPDMGRRSGSYSSPSDSLFHCKSTVVVWFTTALTDIYDLHHKSPESLRKALASSDRVSLIKTQIYMIHHRFKSLSALLSLLGYGALTLQKFIRRHLQPPNTMFALAGRKSSSQFTTSMHHFSSRMCLNADNRCADNLYVTVFGG